MSVSLFRPGDRVFHPVYGLGVIEGVMTRGQLDQAVECYGIRISSGDLLSVPVSRATGLGLRPISNGVTRIVACLRSKAQPLPDDDRLRFAELRVRSRAVGPLALAQAVRDLLNRGHKCRLTPADHKWLESACEQLSAEAAWVDQTGLDQARAVVQREIEKFELDQAPPPAKKHRPDKSK